MKNYHIFLTILLIYIILLYLDKLFVTSESKMIDYLMKNYPSQVVENYIKTDKKWWFLGYIIQPLIITLKIFTTAFCLNFIKLLDLPGLEKVRFSDFVFVSLIAESVFIIAGFYKFINFYWINTDYILEDVQTYYPMSLLNLKEYISTEKWLAYPLQLCNLFEMMYWGFLAWGIWHLADKKISYFKSFGYVALTYGIGLLFWVGVVCFLILSVSY